MMEYEINNRKLTLILPDKYSTKLSSKHVDTIEYYQNKYFNRDDVIKHINSTYSDKVQEPELEITDKTGTNKYLGELIMKMIKTPDRKKYFDYETESYFTKVDSWSDSNFRKGFAAQLSLRNNQFDEMHPLYVEFSGYRATEGPVSFTYRSHNTILHNPQLVEVKNNSNNSEIWNLPINIMGDSPILDIGDNISLYINNPTESHGQAKKYQAMLIGYMALLWEIDRFLQFSSQ